MPVALMAHGAGQLLRCDSALPQPRGERFELFGHCFPEATGLNLRKQTGS